MKTPVLLIGIIVLTQIVISCDETQEPTNTGLPKPVYVSHSECNLNKSAALSEDTHLDCIVYSYQSGSKELTLTHKNAAFNCCPDSITADISIVGDTIIINEGEAAALCNCNCVYDLHFTIGNLDNKAWTIKVVEPYIGDGEILKGIIDLPNEIRGEFCVARNYYPWQ